MLRLVIAGIYAVLAIILCLPYHLYLWILRKKDPYKSWYKAWIFVRRFFRSLLFLAGTKLEVKGLENLAKVPQDKAILFVGNHRSYFDIIILQTVVDRPLGFIAKKEFSKVPLFSWWVADLGSLFIDRSNVRASLETIKEGAEYMKKGVSLGLYPEGTRNHEKELLPFKKGGYKMAEDSESPIVITTMTKVDDIMENNKPPALKPTTVTVDFKEPFYPHQMERTEKKEAYDRIPEVITETLKNLEKNY